MNRDKKKTHKHNVPHFTVHEICYIFAGAAHMNENLIFPIPMRWWMKGMPGEWRVCDRVISAQALVSVLNNLPEMAIFRFMIMSEWVFTGLRYCIIHSYE